MPQEFCSGQIFELQGPTGESNQYAVLPRSSVLLIADQEQDLIQQLLAVFKVGCQPAVLADNTFILKYLASMPKEVAARITAVASIEKGSFDAVLLHGTKTQLLDLQKRIAERDGAIIGITHLEPGQYNIPLERFVIERAISVNTAAAGGNASLMTMS